MQLIAYALGWLLLQLYSVTFHNYGLAIIVFMLLMQCLFIPLELWSKKAQKESEKHTPYVQKIKQNKRLSNNEKIEAIALYYKDNNIRSTGGLLPLILQFIVGIGTYITMAKPLTYVLRLGNANVDKLVALVPTRLVTPKLPELGTLSYLSSNPQVLLSTPGIVAENQLLNMTFFGQVNLGLAPELTLSSLLAGNFWALAYLVLPFIILGLLYVTLIRSKGKETELPAMMSQDPQMVTYQHYFKLFRYTFPFLIFLVSFKLPFGILMYIILSSILQIIKNKFYDLYDTKKKSKTKVEVTAPVEKPTVKSVKATVTPTVTPIKAMPKKSKKSKKSKKHR